MIDWLDNVLIPTNHKRLRECHRVVTEALEKQDIPVVPSCAGLYVWIDLRQYLDAQSFEAEKRLGDMIFENAAYINAGKVFSCSEPGWYRVVIADDPAKIKIGEIYEDDRIIHFIFMFSNDFQSSLIHCKSCVTFFLIQSCRQ